MQCHGVPEYVIVNGRVCVDEGQLRVVEGYGRYIETPTFAPYIYDPKKLASLKAEKNGVDDEVDHLQRIHSVSISTFIKYNDINSKYNNYRVWFFLSGTPRGCERMSYSHSTRFCGQYAFVQRRQARRAEEYPRINIFDQRYVKNTTFDFTYFGIVDV